MTDKELMLSEQLYMCGSAELAEDFKRCRMYTRLFNSSTEEQQDYRKQLIKELFKSTGKNFYIEPPFRCDYGCNISIGENFYSNFDLIILDVCDVSIGNNVFIAPRVSIFTAAHPIDKDVRNAYLEFGKKVKIGNDVWIGGNTVINPGVTIGNNVVIGSGSVVTHDIPDGVIAVGNPCRVLRNITAQDSEYWQKLLL